MTLERASCLTTGLMNGQDGRSMSLDDDNNLQSRTDSGSKNATPRMTQRPRSHTSSGSSNTNFRQSLPHNVLSNDSLAKPSYDRNRRVTIANDGLTRKATLLSTGDGSAQACKQLKTMLGNPSARLKSSVSLAQGTSSDGFINPKDIPLEQAKARARVELDISLQSNVWVQGGSASGSILVNIRPASRKESTLLLSEGKIRIVGFERLSDQDCHRTFYLNTAPLSSVSTTSSILYLPTVGPREEFSKAVEGNHVVAFTVHLPMHSRSGNAKGVFQSHSTACIRYIIMISFRIMDSTSRKESLAHFYRECSVWPRLNPTLVLTAAPQLIQSSTRVEGKKVILTASVHRTTWVAGQQCFVKVQVQNLSRKTIKKIKFALVRTTTVFKSRPTPSDSTTWRTTTTRKEVAEEILEIAQRGAKGYASARGWFFGVEPDQSANLSHSIVIPPDAVSLPYGTLFDVEYNIHISVSTDTSVTLPITIINFLSLDPPPSPAPESINGNTTQARRGSINYPIPHPTLQGIGHAQDRAASLVKDELELSPTSKTGEEYGPPSQDDRLPKPNNEHTEVDTILRTVKMDGFNCDKFPDFDGPGSNEDALDATLSTTQPLESGADQPPLRVPLDNVQPELDLDKKGGGQEAQAEGQKASMRSNQAAEHQKGSVAPTQKRCSGADIRPRPMSSFALRVQEKMLSAALEYTSPGSPSRSKRTTLLGPEVVPPHVDEYGQEKLATFSLMHAEHEQDTTPSRTEGPVDSILDALRTAPEVTSSALSTTASTYIGSPPVATLIFSLPPRNIGTTVQAASLEDNMDFRLLQETLAAASTPENTDDGTQGADTARLGEGIFQDLDNQSYTPGGHPTIMKLSSDNDVYDPISQDSCTTKTQAKDTDTSGATTPTTSHRSPFCAIANQDMSRVSQRYSRDRRMPPVTPSKNVESGIRPSVRSGMSVKDRIAALEAQSTKT